MEKNSTTKNPLIAGFMVSAMALNSPSGHDLIYQAMLRRWFAKEWLHASLYVGQIISFQALKDNAEILTYDPNPDVFLNNMRLLKGNFSFCLPLLNENQEQPKQPPLMTCHAASSRDDKKGKNNLNLI